MTFVDFSFFSALFNYLPHFA
uniref:Uncharacterized protein n=1 Tax=Arundo donax TaxID=35708 RepID=A0A0A9BKD6_ARUDO